MVVRRHRRTVQEVRQRREALVRSCSLRMLWSDMKWTGLLDRCVGYYGLLSLHRSLSPEGMFMLLFLKLKLHLLLSNLFLKMSDSHLILLELGHMHRHLHLIHVLACCV